MRFKRVYIEITNCCNLSCSFCPTSKRDIAFMDIEFFEQILKELEGLTKHVYLHIKGEPLMHPALITMIRLCDERGFMVNLTTNGTLIANLSQELLASKALRQVSFSLQSFEELGKEKLIHYLTDVFDFSNKASKLGKYIELRLWNLERQSESINYNSETLAFIKNYFALEQDLVEEVRKDKGIKLKDRLFLSQSSEFEWPTLNREPIGTVGTCYGLKQQLGILVDGSVVPCCLDQEGDINLGQIGRESLQSILEKPRVQDMIKGFEQRKLVEALCQRCGYKERF